MIFDNGSHQIREVHGMIPATVAGFVLHEVAFVSTGGNGAVWKLSVEFFDVFENGETTK